MKSFSSLLAALLCIAISTTANPVGRSQAQKSALQFLSQRGSGATNRMKHLPPGRTELHEAATPATRTDSTASYYVFNVGQEAGFIIVSGDDRTPAILGYSDEGSFQADNLPENMQAWLKGYEEQMKWISSSSNSSISSTSSHFSPISPLVNSHWNQGEPYNDLCPTDPATKAKSVTGCIATAMAQAIYYHRYPRTTTAVIPDYTCYNSSTRKSLYVERMGIQDIDWDNMLPRYSGTETADEKNAVALLMRLCGQSVRTSYNSTSSSAYSQSIPAALRQYFGFATSVRIATRDNYSTGAWEQLIYNELAEGRPVIYGGQSAGGGHSFIVDGYDTDGLFHVNWGWGGSCDGHFLLSILNPNSNEGIGASSSTDGYAFSQDAIIGMTPDEGLVPLSERLSTSQIRYSSSDTVHRDMHTGAFPIHINADFDSSHSQSITFNYGIGILSSQWQLLETATVGTYTFDNGTQWNDYPIQAEMGSHLPDGTYIIVLASCTDGHPDGLQPNSDSNTYHLLATIQGDVMTLAYPEVSLYGTILADGAPTEGQPITLTATIENHGTPISRELFLLIDGKPAGGQRVELAKGESTTMTMNIGQQAAGTHTAAIALKRWEHEGNRWKLYYDVYVEENFYVEESGSRATNIATEAILQPLADGDVLQQPDLLFKAVVTNRDNVIYAGNVAAVLYSLGDDGRKLYDWQYQFVMLDPGETKTLEFNFDNLPNNTIFAADIRYMVGDYYDGHYNYVYFSTDYLCETPNIDIDISIDHLDRHNQIEADKVSGTITLTNNNLYTQYSDKVLVTLCCQSEIVHTDAAAMTIPPGATQKLRYRFYNLDEGTPYTIAVACQNTDGTSGYATIDFSTATTHIAGDADGNNNVDHHDISFIIRAIATNSEETRKAADVNGDGLVNVADIICTAKKIPESAHTIGSPLH